MKLVSFYFALDLWPRPRRFTFISTRKHFHRHVTLKTRTKQWGPDLLPLMLAICFGVCLVIRARQNTMITALHGELYSMLLQTISMATTNKIHLGLLRTRGGYADALYFWTGCDM